MTVVHTTVGFKGTVDQAGEARRMARLGPRGTVADATAWKVAAAAGDRTVTVAVGSGQACGVHDTTTAVDTLPALPANGTSSTATRWDLIVARWKWTDPVTPVEFLSLAGIAGASGPDLTKLVRTPGTQYDLVLAVVRVAGGQGTLTPNDVFDVRVWGNDVLHVAQLAQFRNVIDVDPSTPLYVGMNKAPALQGFEFTRTGGGLADGALENQGFGVGDIVSDTAGFYGGPGVNFATVPAALDGLLFTVSVGITLNGAASGRLFANLYRSSGMGLRAESYASDTAWATRTIRLSGGQAIALNAFQQSGGGNGKQITGLTVSAWAIGS
jgi:hypothetical protein